MFSEYISENLKKTGRTENNACTLLQKKEEANCEIDLAKENQVFIYILFSLFSIFDTREFI
jgi:hypothetical protein